MIRGGWCFALFLASAMASNACELRVHVNEFPPYSYQVDQQWQGSRVVLSKRLAEKLGCDVKFLEMTWARALAMLQTGDVDLMFNLTPTAEREQFVWFTPPHHHERLVFATTDPEWANITNLTQLTQFPGVIAITQGSYMGHQFMQLLAQPTFQRHIAAVSQRKAKNNLVLKGRAQAVVEDLDYLQYAIANYPDYDKIKITPLVLSEQDVSAGLSRKSPLFTRKIDIELAINQLDQQGLWFSASP